MSYPHDFRQYDPLRETERRVEEEEKQRLEEAARPAATAQAEPEKDNSAEARLAAFTAELAEKLQQGRITESDMAYQLRRFDNALVVEMNNEDTQHARDAAVEARAAPGNDAHGAKEEPAQAGNDQEAEAIEHAVVGRGEISETRAARLERLRQASAEITRAHREQTENGLGTERDAGDRSR